VKRPTFLTLDEVLALHADQVERYGGEHGVRDVGLLESAIAMPQATFRGRCLHAGFAEMAAAYLYHLVRNHPFSPSGAKAAAQGLCLDAVWYSQKPAIRLPRHQPPRRSHWAWSSASV
jgi:hypothetical protein